MAKEHDAQEIPMRDDLDEEHGHVALMSCTILVVGRTQSCTDGRLIRHFYLLPARCDPFMMGESQSGKCMLRRLSTGESWDGAFSVQCWWRFIS